MGKSRTLGTNMDFVYDLFLKVLNIHMNLICFDHNFDHNFDHLHISAVTFVPKKQSNFFHKNIVFSWKSLRYVRAVGFVLTF